MLCVKDVEVHMLDGRKWVVQVNPLSATAGDVLENVLREADVASESNVFSLSLQLGTNEFCPLSNDVKLAKVAPQVCASDIPSDSCLLFRHSHVP